MVGFVTLSLLLLTSNILYLRAQWCLEQNANVDNADVYHDGHILAYCVDMQTFTDHTQ